MKCYSHPKTDAVGVCKNCGKGICKGCAYAQDYGLFCIGCSTTVAREKYNPATIAFSNLLILGLGFFLMKEWGKGLLSIFAGLVAYSIFGWGGMAIVYLFVMTTSYDTAKSLNKGRMINVSTPKNSVHENSSIEKNEKKMLKTELKTEENKKPKVKKSDNRSIMSSLSNLSPASIFYGFIALVFLLVSLTVIAVMLFNFFANNQYGSFGQAVLGNLVCCLPVLILSSILGFVFSLMFRQACQKDMKSLKKI